MSRFVADDADIQALLKLTAPRARAVAPNKLAQHKSHESYFGECPRDELGHCKPNGEADAAKNEKPQSAGPFRSSAKTIVEDDDHTRQALADLQLTAVDVASLIGAAPETVININGDADGYIYAMAHNPNYYQERIIYRDGDQLVIKNQQTLPKGPTGQGAGTQVLANQISAALALGVNRIEAVAERSDKEGLLMNGYYTWPRLGFDAPFANLKTHGYGTASKQRLQKLLDDLVIKYPTATKVSDLMKTPEDRAWWKAHGTTVADMHFDLTPGSQSLRVFNAYLHERQQRGA